VPPFVIEGKDGAFMKSPHLLLLGALLATIPLISQSQPDSSAQQDDPPNRVARLNWIKGDVSFQPAGLEEWTGATLNYPLTTSDHLFTGTDSRAEIHIGPNAIRLDANTNFGFLNLDDSMAQVSLTEGSMEIRLLSLDDNDTFEVATPNGAITLLVAGDYRIDTDPDRDATMLTVRGGRAELFSGAKSVLIRAQQTAYFRTDQNPVVQVANDPDAFDSFVSAREDSSPVIPDPAPAPSGPARGMDRFLAVDHVTVGDLVTEGVTGAEDLSAYGSWQNAPGLGDVWVPPVDPNWAPYSEGDWAWVDPWGWTWVDTAPWGFAPFHYGSWAYTRTRWVWVPGPRNTPQIYAPARVTFFGGGANDVNWLPLGPRDLFSPPWRPPVESQSLTRFFANRAAPGAIHGMSQVDFISGNRVRPMQSFSPEGDALGSSPLVMPTRESVLMGTVRMHPPVVSRPLIARTAPPPPPVSFAAQLGYLAQTRGRPLKPVLLASIRKQLPAAVMQRPAVRSTVALVNTPRTSKPAQKSDASKSKPAAPGRGGPPAPR
jgi:hypothetical protein